MKTYIYFYNQKKIHVTIFMKLVANAINFN